MNLDQVNSFMDEMYTLDFVERYSMVPKHHKETVASHSCFVTMYVLALSEMFDFNVEVALKYAISHDCCEAYIDDLNHQVKAHFPEVAASVKDAEHKVLSTKLPKSFRQALDLEGYPLEKLIVKLADTLQCTQYARLEVQLGNNTKYMKDIVDDTEARVKDILSQIGELQSE